MAQPPEGYVWRWIPDLTWRLATATEKRERKCRANPTCPGRIVAVLRRRRRMPTRRVWGDYFYCTEHLYGRRVEGGHVRKCVLAEVGA